MKLDESINELKTFRKSLSDISDTIIPISDLAIEVQKGKEDIVSAVNKKGVTTSTDKTLSQIAGDIAQITQQHISIDGGEMYAEQLYYGVGEDAPFWNFQEVMTSILNNGAYMDYNGILLFRIYRDDLETQLTGARTGGAYLTCDGDFYTYDTIHTWHDFDNGKVDRWFAILNRAAGIDFDLTNDKVIEIHVGRSIGAIKSSIANNVEKIVSSYPNSSYKTLQFTSTSKLGEDIFLKMDEVTGNIIQDTSVKNIVIDCPHVSGYIIDKAKTKNINSFTFKNLLTYDVPTLFRESTQEYILVTFPQGTDLIGTSADVDYAAGNTIIYYGNPNLRYIRVKGLRSQAYMSNVRKYRGAIIYAVYATTYNKLESIVADDLEYGRIIGTFSASYNYNFPELKEIIAPKNKGLFDIIISTCPKLENIVVGEMEDNFSFPAWNPSSVIANPESLARLQQNIHNNIASRVSDRTGLDPLTFTISQELRDVLLPETEALFASKNWNISPAKSV